MKISIKGKLPIVKKKPLVKNVKGKKPSPMAMKKAFVSRLPA